MDKSYCPSCGRSNVVVGLDGVLLETRPTVRNHACGVGGPGSSSTEGPCVACVHNWRAYWELFPGGADVCTACGTHREASSD